MLFLTPCNFIIDYNDSLTLEANIMDTELLIYFVFASKINLNFSFLHLLHFLKGNTDIIIHSPVMVKSNYLAIQYCK